jgi:hypothetical protein
MNHIIMQGSNQCSLLGSLAIPSVVFDPPLHRSPPVIAASFDSGPHLIHKEDDGPWPPPRRRRRRRRLVGSKCKLLFINFD